MESLMQEQENIASTCNLAKSVDDVQKALDLLIGARESIVADAEARKAEAAAIEAQGFTAADKDRKNLGPNMNLIYKEVEGSFKAAKESIGEIHKAHQKYSRSLEAKFKDKPFPTSENDVLSAQPGLINRAIAMHLLREGQFSVASQFLIDTTKYQTTHDDNEALGIDPLKSEDLRKSFSNMYYILHELRLERNLLPAVGWARENSEKLEHRGSNLEFELGQLQFVYLFTGGSNPEEPSAITEGRLKALEYARHHFGHFQSRYLKEISQLGAAMAYSQNLSTSPYRSVFLNSDTWDYLAGAFTKEFCSLLGLSSESPLYVAVTAGAIALPTLLKLQTIMKDKRAEWTTAQELPVEIPLPPSYQFHSIFVCPVSKEQTTDENPPMMMPCGHVVAQETLSRMSKGSRFKCPYCPSESRPTEARKLVM